MTTTTTATTTIEGADGETYAIYHISAVQNARAFDTTHGDWFYAPSDDMDGESFSSGYQTREAATAAAIAWADEQASADDTN